MEFNLEVIWERMAENNAKERAEKRKWEDGNKGVQLKLMDVVKTKYGTLAVVNKLSYGDKFKHAALTFADNTRDQKVAWYHPSELRVIGNVEDWAKLKEKNGG